MTKRFVNMPFMPRTVVLLLFFLSLAGVAQNVQPAFEVASIKPNNSSAPPNTLFRPGGGYEAANATLKAILSNAFDIPQRQIVGGPNWIDSDRYDVNAKAESGLIPQGDRDRIPKTREMLRNLLADRFQLLAHREMKEQPIYALVVAKGGHKLKPAKTAESDCPEVINVAAPCRLFVGGQGRGLVGRTIKISELARTLSIYTDRVVVDKTAIEGMFDIDLDPWLPLRQIAGTDDRDTAITDPSRPSLFVLLEEQLGLRLDARRGEVEVLVIDSAQKPD